MNWELVVSKLLECAQVAFSKTNMAPLSDEGRAAYIEGSILLSFAKALEEGRRK